ncbi:MAG TPA: S41 family peptidase [Patescibacteria group bacterium]|nr:S41 family peptidase [Patescibacteria group bacterium]
MKLSKLQLVLVIAITFLGGYFFGVNKVNFELRHYVPQISIVNKEPPAGVSTVDFSLFWSVWDKIVTGYYDKSAVNPQKMLYGAISGMVASLNDPYTMFLPPTQQTNFQQQLAGQFTGIGAELGLKNQQIIVIAPLTGSPAEKAGIKAGDAILKVDGQSTSSWTLPQAVDKIRGPKGTTVVLTIAHKDASASTDITITRDVITVKSVDGWIKPIASIDGISDTLKNSSQKDNSVVYVRLSQFGDNTDQDWSNLVASLLPKIKSQNPKGMILDLRNNPGGYLTDAVFIAGEFLPQGTSVVIQDTGTDKTTLSVNRDGNLMTIPLVILINKGSASASEIVSGSMRDNGRAKLIGDTSFGKGTVQQALDLGNSSGLHVTIAKWLTPKGTWVHGKGLTPDVSVALDEKDPSHDSQLEAAIQELLK